MGTSTSYNRDGNANPGRVSAPPRNVLVQASSVCRRCSTSTSSSGASGRGGRLMARDHGSDPDGADESRADDGASADLDLPWSGEPWPPYLPLPNGQWTQCTRENARLCVNTGWHELVDAVFDICDVVAPLLPAPVAITALAKSEGRLVIRTWYPSCQRTLRSAVILLGVRAALDEITSESRITCEVCGCEMDYLSSAPALLGLCEEHAGSTWIPGDEAEADDGPDADGGAGDG